MADVTNLTNFLNDVANSIKEKRGYSSEQKIAAANFDTEIANISSGGTNTADATAAEGDIVYGMTAYINTGKVTGTLPVPATVNADFSSLDYNYSSGEFHTNAIANVLNKAVVSNITQVSSVIPVDNIFNVLDGSISVGMTNSSLNYNYMSGNILINSNFDPSAEPYHLYDNRKLIIDNATRFYTNIPVDNVFNAIDAAPYLYTVNNILNFSGGNVVINSNLDLLTKQLVDRATVLHTNIPADDILNAIGATPYLVGNIASLNYDMDNIVINATLDLGSYKTIVDNVTNIGLETSASNILNAMYITPNLYSDSFNTRVELYSDYLCVEGPVDVPYRVVADNTTYVNGLVDQNIVANVINLTPDILKSGETVLGVVGNYSGSGSNTSDANALPIDIKSGVVAYTNTGKITGTLPVLHYPVNTQNATDFNYQFIAATSNLKNVTRDGINYVLGEYQVADSNQPDSWMFEGNRKMKMGFAYNYIANVSSLTSDKLRKGATVLGVTGTFTSDANATANDIVANKTAYVNGSKITGDLNTYNSGEKFEQTISMTASYDSATNMLLLGSNPGQCAFKGGTIELSCPGNTIAARANITANKIAIGETVLGIEGTYIGTVMKEYASVIDMNNDIANISEGEVVKVVSNGTTTFYVKETTMKKLVKEEDTISPEEYLEDLAITQEILNSGEPEPTEIQDHYEIEYD